VGGGFGLGDDLDQRSVLWSDRVGPTQSATNAIKHKHEPTKALHRKEGRKEEESDGPVFAFGPIHQNVGDDRQRSPIIEIRCGHVGSVGRSVKNDGTHAWTKFQQLEQHHHRTRSPGKGVLKIFTANDGALGQAATIGCHRANQMMSGHFGNTVRNHARRRVQSCCRTKQHNQSVLIEIKETQK